MTIIDISPKISAASPVFPGDQPFTREESMSFSQGDHLCLSAIRSTVHIGAHADAPNHYHQNGVSIDQRDLHFYLGPCQVVEVSHVGARRLQADDFDLAAITTPRVLFKTKSFRHYQTFQNEFTSLSPEVIQRLATKGVKLIGIDTPSVDPADSKELESHQEIYRTDMAILEGLDLDQVAAGPYILAALPLAIQDGDASPVRAVLVDQDIKLTAE
jgi:arylformamidase